MRSFLQVLTAVTLLAVLLLGCSAPPQPTAVPSPFPTVNVEATVQVEVEATVQARVKEELAKMPTATPRPVESAEATAAASVLPSVVRVSASGNVGTGLVIGDGLVITNRHVVEGATTLSVQPYSGPALRGSVAIRNSVLDLALVRVPSLHAPAATLADVSSMKPGDAVLAIGYPLDLQGEATVTRGLFSAVRIGEPLPGEWVQTDAAVNPGNSGGPLINLQGEVVGLITMRQMTSQTAPVEGINFALSSTSIQETLPTMLLATGTVPPDATPLDDATSKDLADFLQKYDAAETLAFSKSDPAAVQELCAPGLFSFVSSVLDAQQKLNVHRESTLLQFKLQSAYVLPGNLVVADVYERWHSLSYQGEALIQDEGETDEPQVVAVRRTSKGWQLAAVQFKDADALGGTNPNPSAIPSASPSWPTNTPIPAQRQPSSLQLPTN